MLRFSEHLDDEHGEAMFRHACALGLEGIVSKKLMSRYKSGRVQELGDARSRRAHSRQSRLIKQ